MESDACATKAVINNPAITAISVTFIPVFMMCFLSVGCLSHLLCVITAGDTAIAVAVGVLRMGAAIVAETIPIGINNAVADFVSIRVDEVVADPITIQVLAAAHVTETVAVAIAEAQLESTRSQTQSHMGLKIVTDAIAIFINKRVAYAIAISVALLSAHVADPIAVSIAVGVGGSCRLCYVGTTRQKKYGEPHNRQEYQWILSHHTASLFSFPEPLLSFALPEQHSMSKSHASVFPRKKDLIPAKTTVPKT